MPTRGSWSGRLRTTDASMRLEEFSSAAIRFSRMTNCEAIELEKLEYKGWQNCYRVSNGDVELIVTGDVGPRIIRFGYVGGQNLFKELQEQLGMSGEEEMRLRGGHRLWMAPEDPVATWVADNAPVEITGTPSGLVARAPAEPLTKLQKEIEVSLASLGSQVTVTHRITNRSQFVLEFSPWAVTMMAPGGVGVTGFPPRGMHPEHLQATNPLVMWAYTDLSDQRLSITAKYLLLRQDSGNTNAQKFGLFNPDTWGAYWLHGELFVKRMKADPKMTFPDFGCSFETFTNHEVLELETLGPLTKVAPGQMVELVEDWGLYRDVGAPGETDDLLDATVLPLVIATRGSR